MCVTDNNDRPKTVVYEYVLVKERNVSKVYSDDCYCYISIVIILEKLWHQVY